MKTKTVVVLSGRERVIKIPSKREPLVVRISRKKWIRGRMNGSHKKQPDTSSQLLTTSNTMCCLGFDARAMGFQPCDIWGVAMPCSIKISSSSPEWSIPGLTTNSKSNTAVTKEMMSVNDDATITDAVRERKLRALAKRINHKFIFVP